MDEEINNRIIKIKNMIENLYNCLNLIKMIKNKSKPLYFIE